jgi:hypothetical protein
MTPEILNKNFVELCRKRITFQIWKDSSNGQEGLQLNYVGGQWAWYGDHYFGGHVEEEEAEARILKRLVEFLPFGVTLSRDVEGWHTYSYGANTGKKFETPLEALFAFYFLLLNP